MRRRPVALALAVALLTFAVACGGDDTKTFRGNIVDVQAQSLIEWDSITVRDAAGKEMTFLRGDRVDLRFWRASHLREHLAQAEPVTVTYKTARRGLVAVRLADAAAP